MNKTAYGYQVPPESWCRQFNQRATEWLARRGEKNLTFGAHIKHDANVNRGQRKEKGKQS